MLLSASFASLNVFRVIIGKFDAAAGLGDDEDDEDPEDDDKANPVSDLLLSLELQLFIDVDLLKDCSSFLL